MNAKAPLQPPAAANALFPGVSFYQVLVPGALALNQAGDRQYEMVGPFANLAQATQFASARPGALVTVTLVLHEAPPLSADLQAKLAGLAKAT